MGLITAITIICLQLNTRGPCQLRANWIAGVGRPVRSYRVRTWLHGVSTTGGFELPAERWGVSEVV